MANRLLPGQSLHRQGTGNGRWRLTSKGKHASLRYQKDGNLVLYLHTPAVNNGRKKHLWDSKTHGQASNRCTMQEDGNLVIYNGDRPVWASHTWGNPGAFLQLWEGKLDIISAAGAALWSEGTENWP
jgi:hypothetical protein